MKKIREKLYKDLKAEHLIENANNCNKGKYSLMSNRIVILPWVGVSWKPAAGETCIMYNFL